MALLNWVLLGLVLLGLVLALIGKGSLVLEVMLSVAVVLMLAGIA